jgi:hypothetical protein
MSRAGARQELGMSRAGAEWEPGGSRGGAGKSPHTPSRAPRPVQREGLRRRWGGRRGGTVVRLRMVTCVTVGGRHYRVRLPGVPAHAGWE